MWRNLHVEKYEMKRNIRLNKVLDNIIHTIFSVRSFLIQFMLFCHKIPSFCFIANTVLSRLRTFYVEKN